MARKFVLPWWSHADGSIVDRSEQAKLSRERRFFVVLAENLCASTGLRVFGQHGSASPLAHPERTQSAMTGGNRQRLRFVGSIRRECLHYILILGEKDWARVMQQYTTYFNQARPHQGIGQCIRHVCPPPTADPLLSVIGLPVLNGIPISGKWFSIVSPRASWMHSLFNLRSNILGSTVNPAVFACLSRIVLQSLQAPHCLFPCNHRFDLSPSHEPVYQSTSAMDDDLRTDGPIGQHSKTHESNDKY